MNRVSIIRSSRFSNQPPLLGTVIYQGTCMEPATVLLDRGDVLLIPIEDLVEIPS
jgi:hypothetical protein